MREAWGQVKEALTPKDTRKRIGEVTVCISTVLVETQRRQCSNFINCDLKYIDLIVCDLQANRVDGKGNTYVCCICICAHTYISSLGTKLKLNTKHYVFSLIGFIILHLMNVHYS